MCFGEFLIKKYRLNLFTTLQDITSLIWYLRFVPISLDFALRDPKQSSGQD